MPNVDQLAILRRGVDSWNFWRSEHPDAAVDLRLAGLRGVDLTEANLSGADLTEANLPRAVLRRADLRGAILNQADLSAANLGEANLAEASLTQAMLGSADLSSADLSGANLTGALLGWANLDQARLDRTLFSDTDLRNAKGLESCRHSGPSVVDERTIARSGELPRVFIERAGVSRPREGGTSTATAFVSSGLVVLEIKVFIAARRLDAFFGRLPVSHLSLIVRDENGAEYEYEGQPERQAVAAHGRIVVTKLRPRRDVQGIRVPLVWHGPASHAMAVLDAQRQRLNEAAVAYNLLGPNSNTVARTLLLALGQEPLHPAAVAPGFEHDAL